MKGVRRHRGAERRRLGGSATGSEGQVGVWGDIRYQLVGDERYQLVANRHQEGIDIKGRHATARYHSTMKNR